MNTQLTPAEQGSGLVNAFDAIKLNLEGRFSRDAVLIKLHGIDGPFQR